MEFVKYCFVLCLAERIKMKRTLGIERVFTLGQYKTLRLADTIEDIPEELALNPDFVDKIRILQMLNIEKQYRDYIKINEKINANLNIEDAYEALDKAKTTTLSDIEEIIKNNRKED